MPIIPYVMAIMRRKVRNLGVAHYSQLFSGLSQTQGNTGGNLTFLRGLFRERRCKPGEKEVIIPDQNMRIRRVFMGGLQTHRSPPVSFSGMSNSETGG